MKPLCCQIPELTQDCVFRLLWLRLTLRFSEGKGYMTMPPGIQAESKLHYHQDNKYAVFLMKYQNMYPILALSLNLGTFILHI